MRPWPLALALMLGAAFSAPELARSQPAISNQELADRSWMVELFVELFFVDPEYDLEVQQRSSYDRAAAVWSRAP